MTIASPTRATPASAGRCVRIAAHNATPSIAHTYTSTMNTQLSTNRASLSGHNNSVP
ncbi:MAG: hypothetical protein ABSA97_12465 [Verrucomicrobiia bacterium]